MRVCGKAWGFMKCRTCCRGAEPSPWACGGTVLRCLSCIPADVSISPREQYSCRASSEVFGNVNVTFPAPSCWHKDINVSVLVKNPQIPFSSKVWRASLVLWCCQGVGFSEKVSVHRLYKRFHAHKNSFYTCCRPFFPQIGIEILFTFTSVKCFSAAGCVHVGLSKVKQLAVNMRWNGEWCGGVLVPWRLCHSSRVWPRGTAVLLPLGSSAAPSRTMFSCFALGEKYDW